MTTARYRRSNVRAVVEAITQDHAVASELHDALWAVLWARGYDEVGQPLWHPETAFFGMLAFARELGDGTAAAGVDIGEAFLVLRVAVGDAPPIGSRMRVLPAPARECWRFAELQPMGLQTELRFDEPGAAAGASWTTAAREALTRLKRLLDGRRDVLAARRAQLGALNEPMAVEDIWREEMSAISDRVALQTEYTPAEHTSLARARAKGARAADEEERKIAAARKRRFADRGNEEIARFREERWPAMRDTAVAETRKYTEYRAEVVRLEEALQRIRSFADRATKGLAALAKLERGALCVRGLAIDLARLEDPSYADELLRTVELLYAAIPRRAVASTTSFSAYRAPTAGPSVIPPRL